MRLHTAITALVLSSCAFSALSADTVGKVTQLLSYEGHSGMLIRVENMSISAGFCSRNDHYILPRTHSFKEENISILLAAKLADKDVSVSLNKGDCVEGFPRIIHVAI